MAELTLREIVTQFGLAIMEAQEVISSEKKALVESESVHEDDVDAFPDIKHVCIETNVTLKDKDGIEKKVKLQLDAPADGEPNIVLKEKDNIEGETSMNIGPFGKVDVKIKGNVGVHSSQRSTDYLAQPRQKRKA